MNEDLRAFVKLKFKDHLKRYEHTLGVEEVSIELAKIYHASIEKASFVALIHDVLKYEPIEIQKQYLDQETIDMYQDFQVMYHAFAAANYMKETFNIQDEDMNNAVKYHVWGRPKMSLLEKILFVADFTEPNRDFEEARIIRNIALKDLDEAVYLSMASSIDYLILQKMKPSIEQYEAHDYYKEVTRGKTK